MPEVKTIEISDEKYPKLLKKIGALAPKKLFYKGEWREDIFKDCLAVVGSRRLTSYGRRMTEKFVAELAGRGVTIVSGFMYGGDEAAHSSAVKFGGKTIAVMPCGINVVHPDYQKKLYDEILESGGIIISEYEGDFLPQTWSYVQRNRIVAGLCKAIFVTEAALSSGSLITANYAKKFGRKIFALPGQITSEVSKGTINLIREGAEAVSGPNDILSFYKILVNEKAERAPSSQNYDNFVSSGLTKAQTIEQKILEYLQREPMDADTLSRTLCVPASQLGTTLSLLELKGIVNQDSGKYFIN